MSLHPGSRPFVIDKSYSHWWCCQRAVVRVIGDVVLFKDHYWAPIGDCFNDQDTAHRECHVRDGKDFPIRAASAAEPKPATKRKQVEFVFDERSAMSLSDEQKAAMIEIAIRDPASGEIRPMWIPKTAVSFT